MEIIENYFDYDIGYIIFEILPSRYLHHYHSRHWPIFSLGVVMKMPAIYFSQNTDYH